MQNHTAQTNAYLSSSLSVLWPSLAPCELRVQRLKKCLTEYFPCNRLGQVFNISILNFDHSSWSSVKPNQCEHVNFKEGWLLFAAWADNHQTGDKKLLYYSGERICWTQRVNTCKTHLKVFCVGLSSVDQERNLLNNSFLSITTSDGSAFPIVIIPAADQYRSRGFSISQTVATSWLSGQRAGKREWGVWSYAVHCTLAVQKHIGVKRCNAIDTLTYLLVFIFQTILLYQMFSLMGKNRSHVARYSIFLPPSSN